MAEFVVFLSDGTQYTVEAPTGNEARRMAAKLIRNGTPPFSNRDALIFRIRRVSRP
jgi:hypothetical protein